MLNTGGQQRVGSKSFDDGGQRVPVVRVSWERLGVEHELAAGGAAIGGDDRGLDADLWTTPALQAGLRHKG